MTDTHPHPHRLGGLNANEQRELEQRMQKRQVKEFVGVRNQRIEPFPSLAPEDLTDKGPSHSCV